MDIVNRQDKNELSDILGKAAYTIDKAYMPRLRDDYLVWPFDDYLGFVKDKKGALEIRANIRALQVNRWVYDADEQIRDGFKNMLSLFSGGVHNVALIIRRTAVDVKMYFAVKNENFPGAKAANENIALLRDTLRGNFNGTDIELKEPQDVERLLDFKDVQAVSLLCGIPSEKSENYISQGIEKLLNGFVPAEDEDSYTCVILAQPMSTDELRSVLSGYEAIASALTPFLGSQTQFGRSRTDTEGVMHSGSHSIGMSHAKTAGQNLGTAVNAGLRIGIPGAGINGGISRSYGYSWGKTDTDSITDTFVNGTNTSLSVGESENMTITHKSYTVSGMIEKLEAAIKRVQKSQATGLWRTAVYIMSEKTGVSRNAAGFLNSIMQGDDSYLEPACIQTWYKHDKGDVFQQILRYICHLTHPVFVNKSDGQTRVLPTANVATAELSNLFAFPRYSVQGLPVLSCARFGREPQAFHELHCDLEVGCTYHMHQKEWKNRVYLSRNELTKHVFVTGSTGAGKSNAIYHLLDELCPSVNGRIKFLVIEPAKGEYKNEFGGRKDVTVYGTNPYKVLNLLQINPFIFPEDIHVLEHIDRLVEVFNACWPMYAAMPAILRESVERAYEESGWNLRLSIGQGVYPTFDTLLTVLPEVIESSAYSSDTSSDYKGALVTRIRSLTCGIYALVFGGDISCEQLFGTNVIVDISRVGSQETKALIMGILILKLQEFRMSEDVAHNSKLRHVTVLEEAHNLLRRTSTEQSQESSNLQGKSVEMIANAIAEMRTYGEGFVIADQSPGLMDRSVIRNTNTKIILRLTDEGDRLLVGKAAGLNESQISELARLECGAAVISQSEWLEPVLCMLDLFQNGKKLSENYQTSNFVWKNNEYEDIREFFKAAFDIEKKKLSKETVDNIRKWYGSLGLTRKGIYLFENVIDGNSLDTNQKLLLAYYVIGRKMDGLHTCEAVKETVNKMFLSKFGIEEKDPIVQRIQELFQCSYPIYDILKPTTDQTEYLGRRNGHFD